MKFTVIYFVGKSKREKIIDAENLGHAEKIANEKKIHWDDIIMVDKTKGKSDY